MSRQVVRGYLTRPQSWPVAITRDEALEYASRLLGSFEVLEDGPIVTESLLSLCHEVSVGRQQINDANIVATMLARGERRFLTFSTSDFRRFEDRIELMGALRCGVWMDYRRSKLPLIATLHLAPSISYSTRLLLRFLLQLGGKLHEILVYPVFHVFKNIIGDRHTFVGGHEVYLTRNTLRRSECDVLHRLFIASHT